MLEENKKIIEVNNLKRYFKILKRQEGLIGAMKDLFSRNYRTIRAVDGITFSVDKGEILGLIGPNGAGKTTTFNMIAGTFPPSSGRIIYKGQDITGHKPHVITRTGITRTFQLMSIFPDLSVMDNIQVALNHGSGVGFWRTILDTPGRAYRQNSRILEKAVAIMDRAGMSQQVVDQRAGSLSAGNQKLLSLIIALATEPDVLLLDEPVTTLSPERVAHIMALVRRVREEGTTVVIIEHNMRAIFDICDRIVVLNAGRKIADGVPHEIRENKEVIAAYLGGGTDVAKH